MNSVYEFQNRALDIYIDQYNHVNNQIIRQYDTLDKIRQNITNMFPINQRILDIYIRQTNQIYVQMDRLYNTLNEIRNNINYILQIMLNNTNSRNNNSNNNSNSNNTNSNSNNNSNRNNRNNLRSRTSINSAFEQIRPSVLYDYQNPINPNIYTNANSNINSNINSFSGQMSNLLSSFLNTSVTVRPSNEQLEIASRLVRYGDIDTPLSEACPISMDRFNVDDQVRQIHHCGHLFVPSQFDEWFQSNVRCPVCRFDIRNHTTQTAHRNASQRASIGADTNAQTNASRVDMSNNEIIFDLSNNEITDNILNTLSNRLFESLLNPLSNENSNDRFIFDPSNNILLYETIIQRNSENTNPSSSSSSSSNQR